MLCDHKRKICTQYTQTHIDAAAACCCCYYFCWCCCCNVVVVVVFVGILSSSLPLLYCCTHWHWAQAIVCLAVLLLCAFFLLLRQFCYPFVYFVSFARTESHFSANAYNFCPLSTQIAIHVSHSFASNTRQANRCLVFFSLCIFFIYFTSYRVFYSLLFFSLSSGLFFEYFIIITAFFTFFSYSCGFYVWCIFNTVCSFVACVPFEIIYLGFFPSSSSSSALPSSTFFSEWFLQMKQLTCAWGTKRPCIFAWMWVNMDKL